MILFCSFIFKREVLSSFLKTLYIGNLIIGDPTRNGPFLKIPVDVSTCRSFVLKQVSLTEQSSNHIPWAKGVCIWRMGDGRVLVHRPKHYCSGSRSYLREGG